MLLYGKDYYHKLSSTDLLVKNEVSPKKLAYASISKSAQSGGLGGNVPPQVTANNPGLVRRTPRAILPYNTAPYNRIDPRSNPGLTRGNPPVVLGSNASPYPYSMNYLWSNPVLAGGNPPVVVPSNAAGFLWLAATGDPAAIAVPTPERRFQLHWMLNSWADGVKAAGIANSLGYQRRLVTLDEALKYGQNVVGNEEISGVAKELAKIIWTEDALNKYVDPYTNGIKWDQINLTPKSVIMKNLISLK